MGRQKRKVFAEEWLQKYNTEGNSIKNCHGKWCLYRRVTSERREGKANPQPVYEYLGIITEEGLISPKKNRVNLSEVVVREYGFSYTLQQICPDSWKKAQGSEWKARLNAVILHKSRNSYILDSGSDISNSARKIHVSIGTAVSSLQRKLSEEYGKQILTELQMLDSIYLVNMDGRKVLSRIEEQQQALLDHLGVRLEV